MKIVYRLQTRTDGEGIFCEKAEVMWGKNVIISRVYSYWEYCKAAAFPGSRLFCFSEVLG